MKLRGQTILLVSNEPWGGLWFSKHHYALQLAQDNEIVFLDPPTRGSWRGRGPRFAVERPSARLRVASYRNYLPVAGPLAPLVFLNEWLVCAMLRRSLRRIGATPTIVWSFDPHRLLFPRLLRPSVSIYHAVDLFNTWREAVVGRHVDVILAVSPSIADKFRAGKVPVALIPHAVPPTGIDRASVLAAAPRREIALAGSLNERVDWQLLLMVACSFPDCTLRLVGPLAERGLSPGDRHALARLRALPNVVMAGAQAHGELMRTLLQSAVGLSAYKSGPLGNRLDSHKVLQYLTLGKPVVSTELEAYSGAAPHVVRIARGGAEFVAAVGDALGEQDEAYRRERIAFAEQFSFAAILGKVQAAIDGLPRPVAR